MKHNPQFSIGEVECSEGVYDLIDKYGLDLREFIGRHIRCDWGDVGKEKAQENDEIIKNKQAKEVRSIYNFGGEILCVISNPERTITSFFTEIEYVKKLKEKNNKLQQENEKIKEKIRQQKEISKFLKDGLENHPSVYTPLTNLNFRN